MPYPSKSRRKPHPEDAMIAAQVARATRYACHFRISASETRREEGPDLAAIRATAARWDAESRFGRRTIVYAITPEGASFPI